MIIIRYNKICIKTKELKYDKIRTNEEKFTKLKTKKLTL